MGELFCEYCGYRLISELEIADHFIICQKKKEHDSREEKLGLGELSFSDKSQRTLSEFDGKKLHDLYRHSTKLIK